MLNTYQNWQLRLDAESILWLSLDKANASTNTLNEAIFQEFEQILDDVVAQASVKGLIIQSAKSASFILGADIEQFTQLASVDAAFQLIRRGQLLYDKLAGLTIPTVALIDGLCLGGGLELALACDYRVAEDSSKTRLGLPEVMLGIHPGWGGSVRLPALIGAPKAMDLILSGRTVTSKVAKRLGFIDATAPRRQLAQAAHFYALNQPRLHQASWLEKQTNAAWARPLLAVVLTRKLRQKINIDHYPSPFAVVDYWRKWGVEGVGAYLAEANSLAALQMNDTAKNCVRVFFLQNELKNLAKKTQALHHVHVVGAGTMGGDIAAWCALQGFEVTLQDREANAIAPAIKRAHALFKAKLKDRLVVQAALDRLQPDIHGYGIAKADVIIEAIFENADAKQALFQQLEQQAKPSAILATNTSSIPLTVIGATMQTPSRLIGIHFFNPVAKMMLVEVVKGEQTDPQVVEAALAFVRKLDKLPLPVKSSPGFLVNRVLMPYLLECMELLADGYTPETIDAAALRFGMPMGPVELADTVGLDVCLAVATNLTEHFGGTVPERLKKLVAAGHLGCKRGQGFYAYKNGRAVKANTTLDQGVYEKISTRLMFRLFNEGMRCVREEVVASADLLDAGMIFATGFAPFRGGPLYYAEKLGREKVLATFAALQMTCGDRFKPDVRWMDEASG